MGKVARDLLKHRAAVARWRARNPNYKQEWYAKHPDYNKKWYVGYKKRNQELHLERLYGVSPKQYDEMWVAQGGVCAICKKPERAKTRDGTIKKLSVDHNHRTKDIRKLLCIRCNLCLGRVEESVDLLQRMITYLNSHDLPIK